MASAGWRSCERSAIRADFARVGAAHARDAIEQLLLALPFERRHPEHFAAPRRNDTPAERMTIS